MVYYFLFITLNYFSILKTLKDILQHFKFVNWWIRGFIFWSHKQVILYKFLKKAVLQLPVDCQTNLMPCDCLMTVRHLHNNYLMTVWQLFGYCLRFDCQTTDNCLTTAWQLLYYYLTTAWWLPDNCLTTAYWRLYDFCLKSGWQDSYLKIMKTPLKVS